MRHGKYAPQHRHDPERPDITADLLMEMHQTDLNEISAAEMRLAIKRTTFRDKE